VRVWYRKPFDSSNYASQNQYGCGSDYGRHSGGGFGDSCGDGLGDGEGAGECQGLRTARPSNGGGYACFHLQWEDT
jgi:hypothetical protein